jgi:hypothetical protein
MKIYVASSWRNPWQPGVVKLLRTLGHEVYDFREPTPGAKGFSWSEIDSKWKDWNAHSYKKALSHPVAESGFKSDMDALKWCDACVMVLPCGNSANLECGWACGNGKRTAALFPHDITITPIGGHSVSSARTCAPCGDIDGCWLPGKLHRIEPELMTKMCDDILLSAGDLIQWVSP